ncbi:MAG: hypothetical protein C0412_02090 [Flavobacterium sp.]|nr:hypothetical protein [Flavobacterium sp.]
MNYYIDETKFSLKDLQKRIEETDLIPSRISLLENIETVFEELKKQGIKTLADLRKQLKTPQSINAFSIKSSLDEKYLSMLRREVESYFPKAFSINKFTWLSKKECEKLTAAGLNNTKKAYETLSPKDKVKKISAEYKIDTTFLDMILNLVDLTRIQWTSSLFARMLYEAGYNTSKKVARADAEELCNAVDSINKKGKYFNGKIGLRDIKRLINSAKYVS